MLSKSKLASGNHFVQRTQVAVKLLTQNIANSSTPLHNKILRRDIVL